MISGVRQAGFTRKSVIPMRECDAGSPSHVLRVRGAGPATAVIAVLASLIANWVVLMGTVGGLVPVGGELVWVSWGSDDLQPGDVIVGGQERPNSFMDRVSYTFSGSWQGAVEQVSGLNVVAVCTVGDCGVPVGDLFTPDLGNVHGKVTTIFGER